MAGNRAPKQWSLTKHETITSFEAWRHNLQYTLSLDPNFAPYLIDGVTWSKKTTTAPLRGFEDDNEPIPEAQRRTAAQKVTQLELLLGQIANYCPVISRNTIVKNSTSLTTIWQAIRAHFGFQSTGAHFLDFNDIHLEPDERPEDLYQRLVSFGEDNLLKSNDGVRHHGENITNDEEISPTLENMIVLTWLRLIHPSLPALVKQRYGADLRSQTIASIKPEISQALDSLLDEIQSTDDAKVLRTAFQQSSLNTRRRQTTPLPPRTTKTPTKCCPLCKQADRQHQHYLSKCPYLPIEDKQYISRSRQVIGTDPEDPSSDCDIETTPEDSHSYRVKSSTTNRVSVKQSPHLKAFFDHHPLLLTLDTGAETSMIKSCIAKKIGATIQKTSQKALQADGITQLKVVGEVHLVLSRSNLNLQLDALVVDNLDVDILAGTPFMITNDVSLRPAKQQVTVKGHEISYYGAAKSSEQASSIRRTQAIVLCAPAPSSIVWPGQYLELDLPEYVDPDSSLAIEPRRDCSKSSSDWPAPCIIEAVAGKIRIPNETLQPKHIPRHDHLCQAVPTFIPEPITNSSKQPSTPPPVSPTTPHQHSSSIKLDPDFILPESNRKEFSHVLEKYDDVFDTNISGYNGAAGPFEAVVNMGPVQPPQRKGRLPQYAPNKMVELQEKFDDLELQGIFQPPENLGITVEYLNPSFLIKKPNGGHRLVTAFADVGRYSKPQPSLLPDVDSTLRTIAKWKYIIVSDLTSAFYQIPLAKSSMKYCGVVTPFRGVRVYTRSAMGMPGSETALEELMCRVLGDCLKDGIAAKLADDLYCGADTPEDLLVNWTRILDALRKSNIKLSPSKTIICPRSTTILGWIWTQGQLSASPHRVATLSSCPPPDTVRGLRSFIGAYKVLSRVLPHCAHTIAPLETSITGLQSRDKISWSDTLLQQFQLAQASLSSRQSITLPKPSDKLWIVTDGSVTKRGIGATLYVARDQTLRLAGFFSAKLRKHQVNWLPCEVEALGIAAAVKHFSPYIIQSEHHACVLTDSKPCVQAIDKLRRGEFSASPRVTSFLSVVSRYQIDVQHLAGSANIPSDFSSRNAPECCNPQCQICSFISTTEDSVVRSTTSQDIHNLSNVPFTTRSSWIQIQSECPDLRRTHAHLQQGTRPSKKLTNIKDVKRYLNALTIAKDGLLVVRKTEPLSPPTELIVIPRSVIDGLVTALHIKLDHPSKHQLLMIMKRSFYALDMQAAVARVSDSCHMCVSLKKLPQQAIQHTTDEPPKVVGVSFAADVLKRCKQNIFVLRDTATSYTVTSIIPDEKATTLRDALGRLSSELHSVEGPPAVVRVDPAPGFIALRNDPTLKRLGISLEIGRVKNVNKNPVAEKAISELQDEILRQAPNGGPVSSFTLAVATSRLNSRLRRHGLSARELWTQRDQFTHDQLPVSDRDVILKQHLQRKTNHPHSQNSKNRTRTWMNPPTVNVGDLVYLVGDRDKTQPRSRYLVISVEDPWCFVKKFSGNQLRALSYKVKISNCLIVPNQSSSQRPPSHRCNDSSDEEIEDSPYSTHDVPPALTLPADYSPASSCSPNSVSPSNPSSENINPTCQRPQRDHKPPQYYGYNK